jgi:hypothetical protein
MSNVDGRIGTIGVDTRGVVTISKDGVVTRWPHCGVGQRDRQKKQAKEHTVAAQVTKAIHCVWCLGAGAAHAVDRNGCYQPCRRVAGAGDVHGGVIKIIAGALFARMNADPRLC